MVPAWFAIVVTIIAAVLGVALGIFSSQATLGRQVTEALTLLKDLTRRVGLLEARPLHYHRRADDPPEG